MDDVKQLCDKCDVLLLQETWLLDTELQVLSNIHKEFYSKGISAMDTSNGIITGRPYGGLAILWRKTIGSTAVPCLYDDERIMGLQITGSNAKLLLINTYLPCSSTDNLDEYAMYLSKLDSIIMASDTVYNMVLGDFNADTSMDNNGCTNHLFGRELVSFCKSNNLILSDLRRLPNNSYTFISHAHGTTSWLDHAISTASIDALIDNVTVEYDTISSDHFPLCLSIDFAGVVSTLSESSSCRHKSRVKWDTLSNVDIQRYTAETVTHMTNINLDFGLLMCDDPLCKREEHKAAIDVMYDELLVCLNNASASLLSCNDACHSDQQIPGWNDWVKEHHANARDSFLLWRSGGSPRCGQLFDMMKKSRAAFKLALRSCRQEKDRCAADSLANKLMKKDSKSFWKEINKMNNKSIKTQTTTINGVTGEEKITYMWQQHYTSLLNSSTDVSKKQDVLDTLEVLHINEEHLITPAEVEDAIRKLKKGKSVGLDGISSEHFIYASKKVALFLCMIFNCMLKHSYLPDKLMDTVIISLVKDKKELLTDTNNYRPISITCMSSKILENVVLKKFSKLFNTTGHQFGYKEAHSTDLCIFAMKEVISYYHDSSTPVYACFIDASKAFDKINHWILLSKLLDRGIPKCFVRLFMIWFATQNFIVRWGNTFSSGFKVQNGVRQGGILSPLFFNIYVDYLSQELDSLKVGCYINKQCVNHLFYADDAVLLAPTVGGLQRLIDACAEFATVHDISYNFKKTLCVPFVPKVLGELHIPSVYLGQHSLRWVNEHKYLGFRLTSNFSDNADILRQTQSIYKNGNMLMRHFLQCSISVKAELFKVYCYNMYCVQLWKDYTSTRYNKCKTAYNNIFRNLFRLQRGDSTSGNMVNMEIDTFNIRRRKGIYKFYTRLLKVDNCLISSILQSLYFVYGSRLFKSWTKCLYL